MQRWCSVILLAGIALFAAGCPKGKSDYSEAQRAETLQDYDAALNYYEKALKSDPHNATYKLRFYQVRFEAGEMHVKKGLELRQNGDLQGAVAQFQRAAAIDPSSPAASAELKKTLALLEQQHEGEGTTPKEEDESSKYLALPPELKPLSIAPINLRMVNADSKAVFDTIGKLAGLTMIYDPDYPARRISVELNNVTLEQALEIASFESKAFVKPVTENIVMVIPDQTQKRRDYEEEILKTFYMSNTVTPQDLTEIVTGLRQLFDLKRIVQVNSQNAITVRATPDVMQLITKVVNDIDKAKPEVVVQVQVLEARLDHLTNLGILPPQSFSVAVNPNANTTSSTTTTTSNSSGPTLENFKKLNSNDVIFSVPTASVNAILTDTDTKIIQNPELRSIDGQQAKLKIGDRIPIATGSFQAGVGVGAVGTAGLVNPLVNTQFQYQDVGVNIDITPRVHPNHEVSLKTKIEVSAVTGTSTIGGISQPIISQRVVEHDIRLKEGEVSILGGLIQRTDTKTLNGWPGLAKIPIIRYLFSTDNVEHQEDEVLIVLIPRIVRLPDWTLANLRAMYSGTDQNVQVKKESAVRAPAQEPPKPPAAQAPGGVPQPQPGAAPGAPVTPTNAQPGAQPGKLRFEPQAISLKAGETRTVAIVVDNVNDLFSIPMLLQYNPAVISIEEIQHAVSAGQHGGFLSGGTQEIAIVSNVNKERGQAIISATRQPNTQGVSGSGTLLAVVIKGVGPGSSSLQIVQQNAKDSQQRPIPLVTSEAAVQVQP